ncbi:UNVERIFIED_CONTAM: putative cytochrome c biosynthesis protein [Sesamum calycinum]|uniref:Cytochrome c biosynthesis protein n=1 Tax=Sesamum calycinum TaxID=2727403 RepID=A0AAW2JVK1_9LAMI
MLLRRRFSPSLRSGHALVDTGREQAKRVVRNGKKDTTTAPLCWTAGEHSGTFSIRSGLLAPVHSFATDDTRGIFLWQFFLLMTGISMILFCQMKQQTSVRRTYKKEMLWREVLLCTYVIRLARKPVPLSYGRIELIAELSSPPFSLQGFFLGSDVHSSRSSESWIERVLVSDTETSSYDPNCGEQEVSSIPVAGEAQTTVVEQAGPSGIAFPAPPTDVVNLDNLPYQWIRDHEKQIGDLIANFAKKRGSGDRLRRSHHWKRARDLILLLAKLLALDKKLLVWQEYHFLGRPLHRSDSEAKPYKGVENLREDSIREPDPSQIESVQRRLAIGSHRRTVREWNDPRNLRHDHIKLLGFIKNMTIGSSPLGFQSACTFDSNE